MNQSEIKAASDDTLRLWARNAYATFLDCNGHDKAQRNKSVLSEYQYEMRLRNMSCWGSNLGGECNGEGSL